MWCDESPELCASVDYQLWDLDINVIPIKVIVNEVVRISMRLSKLDEKFPENILKMINRIASDGDQEDLAILFKTQIVHRILVEFLNDSCESVNSTIDVLCSLATNAADYWCKSIPNMAIPDLIKWLSKSGDHDNKQHIVRIIGALIKDQDESIKTVVFNEMNPVIIPYIEDITYPETTLECLLFVSELITYTGLEGQRRADILYNNDCLTKYLDLLNASDESIIEISLKIVADIAAFSIYNQFLVKERVLHTVTSLLSSSGKIQTHAISLIRNVAVSKEDNFNQDIIDANLLPQMMLELHSLRFGIQQKVVETIDKFSQIASKEQLQYLINSTDAIMALCSILNSPDVNLIYVGTFPSLTIAFHVFIYLRY